MFSYWTNTSRRHFCKRESLSVLPLTHVFIILIKFPPKKLRAVKVEQLTFLVWKFERNFPTAASRPEVRHRIKPGYCRPWNFSFVRYCVTKILAISDKQTRRKRNRISSSIPAQLSSDGILTNNFFERSVDTRSVVELDRKSGDYLTYGGRRARSSPVMAIMKFGAMSHYFLVTFSIHIHLKFAFWICTLPSSKLVWIKVYCLLTTKPWVSIDYRLCIFRRFIWISALSFVTLNIVIRV